jgi:predicted dehydrogenase
MTIRLGFYGAGLISTLHTFMVGRVDIDHKIVAVCDPVAERAAAMAQQFDATACDEDELLDLVDAVFITCWTSEHERLVNKAAERGLAIFCEKPLAFDAASAARMAKTVTDAGVINQVGLVLRTSPAFRVVKQLIADERAGKTLAIVFRDDQFIPNRGHYGSTWRMDKALAGRGTLLEHSIHDVDILQWMLGPVAAVSGATREHHGFDRIDDLTVARLEFDSGAIVSLTSVWHDIDDRGSLRHVEVFCDNLYVKVEGDRLGPVRWQFNGEEEQVVDGKATHEFLNAIGDAHPSLEKNFLEAVRDQTAADPAFSEALPAHHIVDAIYASADAGGDTVRDVYRTR